MPVSVVHHRVDPFEWRNTQPLVSSTTLLASLPFATVERTNKTLVLFIPVGLDRVEGQFLWRVFCVLKESERVYLHNYSLHIRCTLLDVQKSKVFEERNSQKRKPTIHTQRSPIVSLSCAGAGGKNRKISIFGSVTVVVVCVTAKSRPVVPPAPARPFPCF